MNRDQAAAAKQLLAEYRAYLAPVPPARLLARITTLLAHFWEGFADHALKKAVALDWADDLEEFPEWAVEDACRQWRRAESRKPTPADIRQRCHEETAQHRVTLRRLEALVAHDQHAPPPTVAAPATGRARAWCSRRTTADFAEHTGCAKIEGSWPAD